MTDLLVRRDDLRECRIAAGGPPEPGPGQARLRVDAFGLTANNATYAVLGESMSYWEFFPAPAGWGRLPVWGFAEVEAADVEGLEPGARAYGYLPASSHLLVTPADVDGSGFVDASPHRASLPAAYQRYVLTDSDPLHRSDTEDLQMLLRPLFFTSFLIDDQLADDGLATRRSVVISSASSKTAIGTAFLLRRRGGVDLVALTSARSAGFVEELGIYDRTVTYDAVESLERAPTAYVDVAGDAAVRRAVHSHLADDLADSMIVGATHWREAGGAENDLPGPAPAFFFAPDRAAKRSRDWGRAGLASRVAEAWHPFCAWTAGWLDVVRGEGFDAVRGAYLDVLEGRVDPRTAHVLSV